MKKYNVAILGIRGAVGQCMYRIVRERKFPVQGLKLLSPSGAGGQLDGITYEALNKDSFKGIDIVLSSPGADISKEWAPVAAKDGAVVIDNTSYFRMFPDVPLVVPEVNPEDVKKHKGIIANPNCSTIQMLVALKPLHDYGKIKRIVVSTYQAVSGAGAEAVEEFKAQLEGGKAFKKFAHPIAHNLIPQIDVFQENFYTKEEIKMVNETQKIMHDPLIKVTATCVRVPVFNSHSEAVNIETEKKISREKAIELLSKAPGVKVVDDVKNSRYPMPLDADGKDDTYVGRIREDDTVANGLNLWVVADNLRKGAALNAVQIAEIL
ncbi:MAG: aspartate-semialdehyde dehydrogenase [Candidatus Omnitrophota bacterium]|nr:aspartate-semialdehyde dehydrogenase [Candidatus Omnitrophota bacterium]MDZ4241520.1 aspartate-semialdehyde dehydrogenase [Candidatus Omnitrophota bacterium]